MGKQLYQLSLNMLRWSFNWLGGDINNDGSVTNDLIYVPTAAQLQTMVFKPSATLSPKAQKSGI
jgi:hypothetical protein